MQKLPVYIQIDHDNVKLNQHTLETMTPTHELNAVVSSYSVFSLKLTGGEDNPTAVLTSI